MATGPLPAGIETVAVGTAPAASTHAGLDPLFLFVLFGVCLLYVALVAVDTALRRRRSGERTDTDGW
jgi:hypothetical protein